MGTKRIIAGLLSAVMCGSLLTACADGAVAATYAMEACRVK